MVGRWVIQYAPSGSDHRRSHIGPSCGTSCRRSITRIYSPSVSSIVKCVQLHSDLRSRIKVLVPQSSFFVSRTSLLGTRCDNPRSTPQSTLHTAPTHLVQSRHLGTQPAMHAKHPAIHHRAQTQIVKHVAAVPPHVARAVFALTLVVETVDLGDLPGLVVAADEGDAVWISDFEGEEEKEGLDGVEAAVDKVAWRRGLAQMEKEGLGGSGSGQSE